MITPEELAELKRLQNNTELDDFQQSHASDWLRYREYIQDIAPKLIAAAEENLTLKKLLRLQVVRLEILTGRIRACHEETGNHELLDEAEAFCLEGREALEGRES